MRAAPACNAWIGVSIRRTSSTLARTARHQPQEQEQRCPEDGLANRCEGLIEGLVDEDDPARRFDDAVGDEPVAGASVDPLVVWIELRHDHDRGRQRVDDLRAPELLAPLKRTRHAPLGLAG